MPLIMEQTQLLSRLHRMRRTIRRRLLAYGFCTVLAGGVGAFLAILVVDWLLWLPWGLRLVVGAAFLAGLITAAMHWVMRPWQAPLGISEIAGKLERHFGDLQDRLSSAVDFLERGDAGSRALMRQVILNTDGVVKGMSLESALTLKPLLRQVAGLATAVALLATILSTSPGWARTGLYRYLYPLGEIEWPRRVAIVPLTGPEMVALGESVTVRMVVERGWHSLLRPVVRLRDSRGTTLSLAMQRDRDDSFYATIDAVTEDLEYWFEAGDANTERHPLAIKVVRRPAIVEALASVEPPPYATGRPVRTQDLADGPVKAPIGGYVTIRVQAGKPIPPDPAGREVGLRRDTGTLLPLQVDEQDHHRLSARFEVAGDMLFRIELRDEYGFENHGALQHSIQAVADAAPAVTIVRPRSTVELTPPGAVQLVIRAEDDFGITRLDLHAERLAGNESRRITLTDRLRTVDTGTGVQAVVGYLWSVESLSLVPGDILTYFASATDNRSTADTAGQVGRSAPLRLKIISEVEFESRVREEIALLERRMREMSLDQADLLDCTSALVRKEASSAGSTPADREVAAGLAARQARLLRRLREVANRFGGLGRRMERNRVRGDESRRRVTSMGEALEQIAGGPMTSASAALGGAGETRGDESRMALLEKARAAEEEILDRLHALIRSMSEWGSFQELVTETRELLDRQGGTRSATIELGKSLLGRSLDSLTATEQAALKRVARRQEQLVSDAEQLLARMLQLLAGEPKKDAAGAEAIDAALRVARARDLTRRLRAATQAIGQNRTAAAGIDQKAAEEAMRRMIAALRARENRELELLEKRIRGAEEQVAALIEEQRALRAATHEAALLNVDEPVMEGLIQDQRRLRRNTRLVGEDIGELQHADRAARAVRAAAVSMGAAEANLLNRDAARATAAQDEALASLEDALRELEELSQRTAERFFRRTLAQIREGLEAMREAQGGVNEGIKKLQADVTARGRVTRSEAREASKLAREQSDVLGLLHELMPELRRVPVYEWALRRVAEWMETSRGWLSSRKVDDELVAVAARIVRELDKLIKAIEETQALPTEAEFAEAEGGGGQGRTISLKPVPAVTELLLLKAMQMDVNERTAAQHGSFDLDKATEAQLRERKMLGEDQIEVRRLTELVTARAREP